MLQQRSRFKVAIVFVYALSALFGAAALTVLIWAIVGLANGTDDVPLAAKVGFIAVFGIQSRWAWSLARSSRIPTEVS